MLKNNIPFTFTEVLTRRLLNERVRPRWRGVFYKESLSSWRFIACDRKLTSGFSLHTNLWYQKEQLHMEEKLELDQGVPFFCRCDLAGDGEWISNRSKPYFLPFFFPHSLLKGQTHFLLLMVLPLRPLVLTSLAVPWMLNLQIA